MSSSSSSSAIPKRDQWIRHCINIAQLIVEQDEPDSPFNVVKQLLSDTRCLTMSATEAKNVIKRYVRVKNDKAVPISMYNFAAYIRRDIAKTKKHKIIDLMRGTIQAVALELMDETAKQKILADIERTHALRSKREEAMTIGKKQVMAALRAQCKREKRSREGSEERRESPETLPIKKRKTWK